MAEGATPPTTPFAQEQGFNFLYSPVVGNEAEDKEQSRADRKRNRNPDKWTKKHVKKPALRKNSPCVPVTNLPECCKKKCGKISLLLTCRK